MEQDLPEAEGDREEVMHLGREIVVYARTVVIKYYIAGELLVQKKNALNVEAIC